MWVVSLKFRQIETKLWQGMTKSSRYYTWQQLWGSRAQAPGWFWQKEALWTWRILPRPRHLAGLCSSQVWQLPLKQSRVSPTKRAPTAIILARSRNPCGICGFWSTAFLPSQPITGYFEYWILLWIFCRTINGNPPKVAVSKTEIDFFIGVKMRKAIFFICHGKQLWFFILSHRTCPGQR